MSLQYYFLRNIADLGMYLVLFPRIQKSNVLVSLSSGVAHDFWCFSEKLGGGVYFLVLIPKHKKTKQFPQIHFCNCLVILLFWREKTEDLKM